MARKYRKFKQYKYTLGNRTILVQGYEPQALDYLQTIGIPADDIRCEAEFGDRLNIRYRYRGKTRQYLPDIYVVSKRLIVEVKSVATLGLLNNKQRGWSMTCAKAIECHKRGYRFMLLLMDKQGRRLTLPKNWAYMPKHELLELMPVLNPVKKRVGLFST